MNKIDLEIRNQNVGLTKDLDKLRENNKLELDKVAEQHSKQKASIKQDQDEHRLNLINESEQKKADELARREIQLNDIKASVEKTKKTLQDEKKNFESAHQFQLHEQKDHFRVQNKTVSDQQNFHIKEANGSYNKRLSDLHSHGEKSVRLENENQRLYLKKLQAEGHQKINSEDERFNELYRMSEKRHKEQIDHLEFMQNIEHQEKENSHKLKLLQKQKYFDEELQKQEADQRQRLISNKNEFDIKYANIRQQFEDNLKLLSNKVDTSMGQLKLGLSEKMDLQQLRMNDSFYSMPTLNPTITEREKDYVVRIPVQEIDKGFINLSANDKNITITFNRNFEDKINHNELSESKISKVESFRKSEKVAHFLDGKKIQKNYENGVMTYIVAKKV